jgi:hypothetical protein
MAKQVTGCSAAWLARYLGVVEVVGSNPASPTQIKIARSIRLPRAVFFIVYPGIAKIFDGYSLGCILAKVSGLGERLLD